MEIPLHKIHDIRRLLYTDRPSYAQGTAPLTSDISIINNDQVMKRLINEVIEILNTD